MPKLVFLSGFTGSGKSEAASKHRPAAFVIVGDHLFSKSLRELRPRLDAERENDWSQWPDADRNVQTAARIFGVTVEREFSGLRDHTGHIIADGAIFVYEWFRTALRDTLEPIGHRFENDDVHLLRVNVSDNELFTNIRDRAHSNNHRGHELKLFPDLTSVARGNADYQRLFDSARSAWQDVDSREALEGKLNALLSH